MFFTWKSSEIKSCHLPTIRWLSMKQRFAWEKKVAPTKNAIFSVKIFSKWRAVPSAQGSLVQNLSEKTQGPKDFLRYIKTRWFSSWPFWDGYISDLLRGRLSDLQLGYFWRFESPERVESVIQAILQNDRYLKKNRHSSFFIRIPLGIITGS